MKGSAAIVNYTPSQAVLAPYSLTYCKYACSLSAAQLWQAGARHCAWLDLTHTCRFRDKPS
jgi:hypothetical protein